MGQNSCQPEGLQPESAMAALLVLAIERLLPSPGALPSPILAATHTCFTVLDTLSPIVEHGDAPSMTSRCICYNQISPRGGHRKFNVGYSQAGGRRRRHFYRPRAARWRNR